MRCLLPIVLCAAAIAAPQQPAATAENRFEKNVQAYEAQDHAEPRPRGAIPLAGDSQFTLGGQSREDPWVAERIHPNHEGNLIRVRMMKPLLSPPDQKGGGSAYTGPTQRSARERSTTSGYRGPDAEGRLHRLQIGS